MRAIRPLVLVILDGWGEAPVSQSNAIFLAKKPFWDQISASYPHTFLSAAGEEVGLPIGEAGNSEVGHLNIGAGKIVYQELPRINMAISDGSFLKNEAFLLAAKKTAEGGSNLHLLGLIGHGGVHSSLEHLYSLLWFAKVNRVKNVFIHLFTDGRDSSPTSGQVVVKEIIEKTKSLGVGRLASICGRYYAMDRDKHWERTQVAYRAIVEGVGERETDPATFISKSYQAGVTDEFIKPILVVESGETHTVRDGDAVIFFNFRPDRARQLTQAFVIPNFPEFQRNKILKDILFVTMTEYEKNLPVVTAFPPPVIGYPLAAVLSLHDKRQLHIGETEKYAHVTYFINGGREDPYPGEDRVHIPSPKVATYDQKPEMSALEITSYVGEKLSQGTYDVYVVNFANPDMVAHTGSLKATIKAIEVIDKCLEKITNTALSLGGGVVITADHGNAETMFSPSGGIDTEHSRNRVPFIAVEKSLEGFNRQLPAGILADVAPTVLGMLGLIVPSVMTGSNLLPQN